MVKPSKPVSVVRNQIVKFRVTKAEAEAIRARANSAGVPVSQHLRELGMTGSIKIGKTRIAGPSPEAFELRRLGAMLKSLYPKDSNWSSQEKRQWWDTMNLLIGIAQRLDGRSE